MEQRDAATPRHAVALLPKGSGRLLQDRSVGGSHRLTTICNTERICLDLPGRDMEFPQTAGVGNSGQGQRGTRAPLSSSVPSPGLGMAEGLQSPPHLDQRGGLEPKEAASFSS